MHVTNTSSVEQRSSRVISKQSSPRPAVFDQDVHVLYVDEHFVGRIGTINLPSPSLVYSLEQDRASAFFELKDDGRDIYVNKSLDYELGQRVFNFSIVAWNVERSSTLGGDEEKRVRAATTQVVVLVRDVDDEAPVWSRSVYEFQVS